MTSEAVMSRSLLPLCVSAGGTTRPLEAAVEQNDIDTYIHTHMHADACTHTSNRKTQTTYSVCCRLCLTLELHQSLLQMRAACA